MNNSWKTTVCGLLALIGSAIAQFFPKLQSIGLFLASVGSGAGLLFARDNNVSSEMAGVKSLATAVVEIPIRKPGDPQTPAPGLTTGSQEKGASFLPLLFVAVGLALLCMAGIFLVGCTSFTIAQTDPDGRQTRIDARQFFGSDEVISKLKTTQTDKTQGVGIDSLQQQTSTNAAGTLDAVTRLLQTLKP